MTRIEQDVNPFCQEVCALDQICRRARSVANQFVNGGHDTPKQAVDYIERENEVIYKNPQKYIAEECAHPEVVLDVINEIESNPDFDPKIQEYTFPLEEGVEEKIAS